MTKNSMEVLSQTLFQKQKEDQEQIQQLTLSQLKKLVKNLQNGLSDELDTTKSVTNVKINEIKFLIKSLEAEVLKASTTTRKKLKSDLAEIEKASTWNKAAALKTMRWGWLKYSLPALLVLVTILSASWGAMHLMSQELMKIRQEVLSAEQILEKLPAAVQFLEQSGDQYLLLEIEPDLYQAKSGSWVIKLNKR